MEVRSSSCSSYQSEEDMDVRKGPWTVEEDSLLINYVNIHGEGRWNTAARCAGLNRTGKSCRLRWLNYLRPDVRRGNISLQEQLLILELHSRWGNRWSKIAQELPGRTDNEIKNYWRTRVQKHAKQLKCDVNSKQFRDVMRYVWIPRLVERIQASNSDSPPQGQPGAATFSSRVNYQEDNPATESASEWVDSNPLPDSSVDTQVSPVSDLTTECQNPQSGYYSDSVQTGSGFYPDNNGSSSWDWYNYGQGVQDVQGIEQQGDGLLSGGDSLEELWNDESILLLQQHLMS
ncbi:hypothetical protein Tsubulata_016584 [Turnera subulata]|uniref:Uncharacterized protein n=1 Tax=Turnera subulata TaxID=218843 RepID=A0A9Q0FEE3_9ROSI|nr:hypothetical protein Tsubulata_016584 [Turnera subulata]